MTVDECCGLLIDVRVEGDVEKCQSIQFLNKTKRFDSVMFERKIEST